MNHRLIPMTLGLTLLGLAAAADSPAAAPTSADWSPTLGSASEQIKSLSGKTVWIMNRVDLASGVGEGGPLETNYLRDLLLLNGAKVSRYRDINDVKTGDVLVVGEPVVPRIAAADKEDPDKMQQYDEARQVLSEYKLNYDRWITAAKAAGATVVLPGDVMNFFGLGKNIQPDLKKYQFHLAAVAMDRPIPEADFKKSTFGEVMPYIREVSGLNIEVDWNALQSIGITSDSRVTATIARQPLSEVLAMVIPKNDNGTGAVIADSAGFFITTPERAQNMLTRSPGQWLRLADLRHPPAAALAPEPILPAPLLSYQSGIILYSTGLTDALEYLKDLSGVSVEADWVALIDLGIKKDTPVTLTPPPGRALCAFRRLAASLPSDEAVFCLTKSGALRLTRRNVAEKATDKVMVIEP